MAEAETTPIARLHSYLDAYVKGWMNTQAFCASVDQVFNFEVDKSLLNAGEAEVFSTLLRRISWYSPFPEERRRFKSYIGEGEVLAIVKEAISKLQSVGR